MTPAEARQELLSKPLSQINEETAEIWATRALAALHLFLETHDIKWAVTFADLRHEALEHAAVVDNPDFIGKIRARLASEGGM
jgi:hypothetical protein